ncbi:MAG: terminase family protein [Nitrososphaerales archaeon]
MSHKHMREHVNIRRALIPNSKRAIARKILSRKKLKTPTITSEILLDPIRFAKVLGFDPFEYQAKIMKDTARRIVVCAGRQVGKSQCVAAKAIHFALSNEKSTTLIVSASLRQSMLMFEKISSLLESKLPALMAYRSRTRIKMSNGSSIIALPSGRYGHTLRGFTADLVIIDEAAFVAEEVIANSVLPMLATTNGYCWMLSTPYDKDHVFYKAFTSQSWSVYHLPSSVSPRISKEFLEEQRQLLGELRFQQEYEALFVDDANAYFPMTLLRECVDSNLDETYALHAYEQACCAGYDPGGKKDPAALVIVSRDKNGYTVRFAKTWKSQEYTTTDIAVAEICKKMNVQKLCVDQTGLGDPLVEHLGDIYRKELVQGIFLTQKNKGELLLYLRLLLEQKLIRLPNDRDLLASLNCITYERSYSGNYLFKHSRGTHDDLAYALALAVFASKTSEEGVIIKI